MIIETVVIGLYVHSYGKESQVEQEDVISAEENYSQYALNSLVAENSSMEDLFINFVGNNCIITYEELRMIIDNSSSKRIGDYDEIIKILCNMGFLGPEISLNTFSFIFDEEASKVLYAQAQKFTVTNNQHRFCINKPFHAYLGIEGTDKLVKGQNFIHWIYQAN